MVLGVNYIPQVFSFLIYTKNNIIHLLLNIYVRLLHAVSQTSVPGFLHQQPNERLKYRL